MDVFEAYNNAWKQGKLEKPLIILIGGYCGTGKSTLAQVISSRIEYISSISTGIIRSILQSFYKKEEFIELFEHTYKMHNLDKYSKISLDRASIEGYKEQVKIVEFGVKRIIAFAQTEGKQFVIDGNHVTPSLAQLYRVDNNIITIFLKASDDKILFKNLSGPTHRRILMEKDFAAAKILHDFIVQEVSNFNLPLFDINNISKSISYIEDRLSRLL